MNFFKNAPENGKCIQDHYSAMAPFLIRMSIMLSFLLGASLIGYSFKALQLQETNIAIVYLLAVLLTARYTGGYLFGFWVSLFAAFIFNFLFMEPYYTFSVNTQNYIITFTIMAITAFITSTLTTHAKQNAIQAREREEEAKALYSLTNRLTDAADNPGNRTKPFPGSFLQRMGRRRRQFLRNPFLTGSYPEGILP